MEKSLIFKDVLKGKDGWLFLYNGGQKQFDYLSGKLEISDKSIENFVNNIDQRKIFCDSRKLIYKHIVFPSKPLVKRRYLPDGYSVIESLFKKKYLKKLKPTSAESLLYPLEILIELDSSYSTFRKYDTHMTACGTMEIVNLLLKSCDLDLIKIDDKTFGKSLMGGDLCNMITSNHQNYEDIFNINDNVVYKVSNGKFLPGNTNQVIITHYELSRTKLRLLIFGDSFFQQLIKPLSFIFRDIMYVRSAFMHSDMIELYQPDIVFTGNAERYLCQVEKDENASNFLFDLYGKSKYCPSEEYLNAFVAQLSYKYKNNIYVNWKKNINPVIKLEKFTLGKDIIQAENSNNHKFKCIGNAPMIIFSNIKFNRGYRHILLMEFISSVEAVLKIYYSDYRNNGYPFNEERSIVKGIKAGLNNISVPIDYQYLGDSLRIDPMKKIGEIEILSIMLKPYD